MIASQAVEVRERSTEPISVATFRELESSDRVMRLIDAGILTLVRNKTVGWGLQAHAYTGQISLEDGRPLRVLEKVEGTAAALLGFTSLDERRVDVGSIVGAGYLQQVLAERLCLFVDMYLKHGLIRRYQRVDEDSLVLRGRLDVGRTVQLWSRGQVGMLGVSRDRLSWEILPNHLLGVGLLAAMSFLPASSATSVRVRHQFRAFRGAPVYQLATASRTRRADAFRQALADKRGPDSLKRALGYAQALSLHLGLQAEREGMPLPEAHFLNLETMFEEAVRVSMSSVCLGGMTLATANERVRYVLAEPKNYRADPDFLLVRGWETVLVGDPKYKEFSHHPRNPDVYQVLAHADSYSAPVAALVYPNDAPDFYSLGRAKSGVKLFAVGVRPHYMIEDLEKTFAALLSKSGHGGISGEG